MKIGVSVSVVVCASGLAGLVGCGISSDSDDSVSTTQQRVCDNNGDDAIKAGEQAFEHAAPTGNGRACSTCHIEDDGFALTPAHVEAHYNALPRNEHGEIISYDDDPLFRAVDADDPNAYPLTFKHLMKGLATVKIDLPDNVTVDELPGAKKIRLYRGVMSIWNVEFTAPYQSDRRAKTLQQQARGAAINHMEVQKEADQLTLDNIAAYEEDQFSSDRTRALVDQLDAGKKAARADKPYLTADEQAGREAFNDRCSACHGEATLNKGSITKRISKTFGVSVSHYNRANLPVYTFRFKNHDGTETVLRSPDPGHALISGKPDLDTEFEAYDIPTLYGISKTAPYFHDNSAATLEDVIDLYRYDFRRAKEKGSPFKFVQTEITDQEKYYICAYLRTL
jgi:cytochrome c peroxidase